MLTKLSQNYQTFFFGFEIAKTIKLGGGTHIPRPNVFTKYISVEHAFDTMTDMA